MIRARLALAVAFGLAASLLAAPSRSVKLTVSGYTGTTELENFPVLVKVAEHDAGAGTGIDGFSYSDLDSPSTGGDLWFSADAAGATVIPHDIDEWHQGGTSLVWVGESGTFLLLSPASLKLIVR